jgi:hypothetical protein
MSCTWLPKQSRAARRAFLRSYHRGRWPRRWPTAQVRCQDPWATSQAAASESSHENPQMWCSERVPGNSETQSCALSCWPVVRRYQVSYSRPSSADRRQRTSPSASPQVCVGLQSELRQFQNVSNRSRTPPASLRQGHTVCGTHAMSFRGETLHLSAHFFARGDHGSMASPPLESCVLLCVLSCPSLPHLWGEIVALGVCR